MRKYFPKRASGAPLHTLSKLYDVPVGFVTPPLRLCIALFAVAEGWLLLDIGWFVLFFTHIDYPLGKILGVFVTNLNFGYCEKRIFHRKTYIFSYKNVSIEEHLLIEIGISMDLIIFLSSFEAIVILLCLWLLFYTTCSGSRKM